MAYWRLLLLLQNLMFNLWIIFYFYSVTRRKVVINVHLLDVAINISTAPIIIYEAVMGIIRKKPRETQEAAAPLREDGVHLKAKISLFNACAIVIGRNIPENFFRSVRKLSFIL